MIINKPFEAFSSIRFKKNASQTVPQYGKKLILRNGQSPGDIIMMAYALKALHEQYPGEYVTDVRCPCMEIFEGNPYITPLSELDASIINMEYPTIHRSNQDIVSFSMSFVENLGTQLAIHMKPTSWDGAIFIREEEKHWVSAVAEVVGKDVPYWILDAGHKIDYTAKAWDFERYQEVIDRNPDIWFVQIGMDHPHHIHPKLKGKNLINMIGKTDLRQLIRLVYNAWGVLTPVSLPMVLAYATPAHPRFKRGSRACVVISGGREPNHWQAAANQTFLHTCGQLDCCDKGGSWASRVVPIGDGDEKDRVNLCMYPTKLDSGQYIAKCMWMITTDEVCMHIRRYQDNLNYEPKF